MVKSGPGYISLSLSQRSRVRRSVAPLLYLNSYSLLNTTRADTILEKSVIKYLPQIFNTHFVF
jgi:hypothetical protein